MMYMKIESITLENFRRITSGMKKNKLTIDFSNLDNSINLIIGPNGSGKTSLQRCLHPFAFNGSIGDSSLNSDLISDNCDGKKILRITYGDDVYDIQHIYTRKKDNLSVKSFIQKNGTELNENGTSNSFKGIVYEELGINETFLSILSIGNRVEGFVDYTSADRKNLITKTFVELDIFSKYYKKMVNLMKEKKAILGNIKYKLSKYGNVDIISLEQELDSVQKNISSLTSSKNELLTYIGGINNQLDSLKDVKSTIEQHQIRAKELMDLITDCKGNIINTNSSKEDLGKELTIMLDNLSASLVSKSSMESKLDALLDKMDSIIKDISSNEKQLSMIHTGEDLTTLKNTLADVEAEINSLNVNGLNKLDLNKDDLIKAKLYLDQLRGICNDLVFEHDMVDVEIIMSEYDESYREKVNTEYSKLTSNIDQFTLMSTIDVAQRSVRDYVRTSCKESSKCPYYEFYKNYMSMVDKSLEEVQTTIRIKRDELNKTGEKLEIATILDNARSFINEHSDILNKLPSHIFDKDCYLRRYIETRDVYDQNLLVELIGMCESVERRDKLMDYSTSLKDKIQLIEKNVDLYNSINDNLSRLESDKKSVSDNIDIIKSDISDTETEIEQFNSRIADLDNDIKVYSKIEEYTKEMKEVKSIMQKESDNIDKISFLENTLSEYLAKKDSITEKIVSLENTRDNLLRAVSDIRQLKAEEIEISEDYDIISDIHMAVSPTKGIPVEFIERIFKGTIIDKMNELLDTVYHGNFRLLGGSNITIDDKDFKIPYMKNNSIIVDDISHASDGERAMITLAFSLVLIQLSLDKYTIMLLDELDTSLDYHARGKFIDLLEKFMSIVHCNQLFLISHNNMFDNYPVNVLMTGDMNVSHMASSDNVVKLYK